MAIVLIGLFQLVSTVLFLVGFFAHLPGLLLAGGILVIADDIREIGQGYLQPVVPILLAAALALLVHPWYVGVFWASAVFKLFNIPAFRRNLLPIGRRYAPAR